MLCLRILVFFTSASASADELILKCIYNKKYAGGTTYFKITSARNESKSKILKFGNGEWHRTSAASEINERYIMIYALEANPSVPTHKDERYSINRVTGYFSGHSYGLRLRGSCERANSDPAKAKPKF